MSDDVSRLMDLMAVIWKSPRAHNGWGNWHAWWIIVFNNLVNEDEHC